MHICEKFILWGVFMASKYRNKKAFTMVEVLTVVLIISIIATVANSFYKKAILKARAAEAINLLESVRTKQAQNYARKRAYFNTFGDMSGNLTAGTETRDADNSSLLKVGDYKVELRGDNDCAIAYYQPEGEENKPFVFSISYLKNGLGCDGDICKHFGDVIGSVEDVCAGVEEGDYSCPNNFDPSTCTYPKVIGLDGCSCECSSISQNNCLARGGTWDDENCECDLSCPQTASPDSSNNNWYWDQEECSWQCSLVPDNCSEIETYNASTCKCDCVYSVDSNGNCACPSGQIWDGVSCSECDYNYYTSGDIQICCTEEAPVFDGTECSACPPMSQWNPETKICECGHVDEQGHCTCPDSTPMWNGTECVSSECNYQSAVISGNIYICCDSYRPMIRNNECVACPTNSSWNSTTKQCVCSTGFVAAYQNGVLTACNCPRGSDPSYSGPQIPGTNYRCKCPIGSSVNGNGVVTTTGSVCKCLDPKMSVYFYSQPQCYCPSLSPITLVLSSTNQCACPRTYQANMDSNGNITSCTCPAGTSRNYTGATIGYNSTGGNISSMCHCPANQIWQNDQCVEVENLCPTGTALSYTGVVAQVVEGYECKCPEGSSPNGSGVVTSSGSVCKCNDPAMTVTSWGTCNYPCPTNSYFINNECRCNDYSFQETRDQNGNLIACSCPTGSSINYNGARIMYNGGSSSSSNKPCRCPANQVWLNNRCGTCTEIYGQGYTYTTDHRERGTCCAPGYAPDSTQESGCSRCPIGSTWDDHCAACLCDARDDYGAPYGVYGPQTENCTRPQYYDVIGAYFSTMTCSAGCTLEAHYYDAGLNCCYCAAQVGNNHDSDHNSNGCYGTK